MFCCDFFGGGRVGVQVGVGWRARARLFGLFVIAEKIHIYCISM